jgi:uncharacterized membrane protein YqhA
MKKTQAWIENAFETTLFSLRFFTLIAVIGSAVAAVIMFIQGSLLVLSGVFLFAEELAHFSPAVAHEEGKLITLLISSVDNYLFATVLLIFSVGLYELFISKVDPASLTPESRPNWLDIKSLDDLKSSLGKVILMIMIVSFFKNSLDIEYRSALDLLYLGVGVLFISGALYLTHSNKNKH